MYPISVLHETPYIKIITVIFLNTPSFKEHVSQTELKKKSIIDIQKKQNVKIKIG